MALTALFTGSTGLQANSFALDVIGTNPSQNGFGVAVGAIDSLFQQGAVTPTGRSLDAAIQGRGFFVLSNGATTAYSRAGSFAIDAGGFLVDPNTGYRVQRTGVVGE